MCVGVVGGDASIAVDVLVVFRDAGTSLEVKRPSTVHIVCFWLSCHHFIYHFLHVWLLVRFVVLVKLKAVLSLSLWL